jgi:aspartate/methionine/tyrosine aminotransferase
MKNVEEVNEVLALHAPVLHRLLSPLGRGAFFPPDIPFQAAEARGTTYNGTIGVFTDGAGHALPLPSMAALTTFEGADLDRAFLYSPVLGIADLRDAWRAWQRGGPETGQSDVAPPDDAPSTRPIVTCGLTHGLSLVADLFGGPGRKLAVTTPFWGNYRQTFTLRTGAELVTEPAYQEGVWDPTAIGRALARIPDDEPALALVNFPSNPGGYSPTVEQSKVLCDLLLARAEKAPLLVICDDAYGGLVFEQGVPNRSLFWSLAGRHENLVPVKLDGATKEFALFGGRVGFLTFGADLDAPAFAALENKLASLVRATVGSPVAISQMLLLRTLQSGHARAEVEDVRRIAKERFDAVRPVLATLDRSLLRPLPFNAGFFVLMELVKDLDPHEVRRHLIARYDTGLVASQPNYLRVALCSVAAEALPEMLRRVEQAVRDLS